MADFRKWFIALAVVALMATAASAQVGFANGSASDLLACTATAAGTPELRPEGFTDLAGDIVISCTGGQVLAQGSVVPTVNIVVYMQPSVPITSRWLSSSGASEVLLLVDDPGSGIKTGVSGNNGPNAPQIVCTTAMQHANGGPLDKSPCTPLVGSAAGVDVNGNATTYEVPVPNSGTGDGSVVYNVFQGSINDFGSNSVSFYNVPVLPPATSGVRRTFRITNIRVPGNPAYSAGVTFLLNATISTSPSSALPISGTALNIGILGKPTGATVTSMQSFLQCQDQVRAQSANIVFTEGFATAFKTRVVPMTNTQWAAEQQNLGTQNIPGGLYGGFAANSESGLIMRTLTGTSGGNTYVAGLADFGTRLKAVFVNVPTGISLYVSQTNLGSNLPNPLGGTSVLPAAVLVSTGTADSTIDQSGGVAFNSGSFPIASTLNGTNIGGGSQPVVALASNNGVYTATWEVVNSNPSAIDIMTFGVYITYTAAAPTTTNPYGTPITDLPPGAPVPTVFMTLAPEPGGGGSFNTTTNFSVLGTPIPRFANLPNTSGRWLAVNLCQTTLLYPYVTGAAGFDTGIAVANTSQDPFGTRGQSGSCTLYAYGVTVAAAGNTHAALTVPGCDALTGATPAAGTNCFDRVPAGEVGYINASTGPTGPGPLQNFQGYVIAVCNFQYAHGYAAVTDLGLRNLWSSYLALELNPCGATACTNGLVGSPRKGVQSIEQLVH